MEETAVPKFKHGVIISLPAFKLSDFKAKINADEPELTIRPYFSKHFRNFSFKR